MEKDSTDVDLLAEAIDRLVGSDMSEKARCGREVLRLDGSLERLNP
jgi:hypothetical protein